MSVTYYIGNDMTNPTQYLVLIRYIDTVTNHFEVGTIAYIKNSNILWNSLNICDNEKSIIKNELFKKIGIACN
jgi:hypothetical protein